MHRCLVAEAAGEVVGYTWMNSWQETHDIRLYLLRRNLALLAERGVRRATVTTVAENENDTVRLYRDAGFEVVSQQPRYRRPP